MLHGFEKQTAPLSKKEKILLPFLIDELKDKHGVAKAITGDALCNKLTDHAAKFSKPIIVSGARLRKMIHYIRTNGLLIGLVASSYGYYITQEPQEIKNYISSLESREAAIRRLRIYVERYYKIPQKQIAPTLF